MSAEYSGRTESKQNTKQMERIGGRESVDLLLWRVSITYEKERMGLDVPNNSP
jgi:hypothetical protein